MTSYTTNREKELKERLRLLYETEDEMLDAIMTALGMSATLTQFMMKIYNDKLEKLPEDIKYACSVTSGNMLALLSVHSGSKTEKIKYPPTWLLKGEQYEENLRRKLIHLIEILHEWVQGQKNERFN